MIESIKYNPYRVLGIYADTSTKEIKSIVSRLKAYLSIDKKVGFEGEFSFLEEIERNQELVLKCENSLALSKDKLFYSLFWFIESSQVEEIALDYLSDMDDDKAIEVWDKAIRSGIPSKNTYGSYNNYGTYLLSLYLNKKNFNASKVSKALSLKSKLLFSPFMDSFVANVATEESVALIKDVTKNYFESILIVLERELKLDASEIIRIMENCHSSVSLNIIENQKKNIINKIEDEFSRFEKVKKISLVDCTHFIENMDNLLISFKKIVISSDLDFHYFSDTTSNKIIDAASQYFEKNSINSDPSKTFLNLLEKAKKFALKTSTKERITRSKKDIDIWIKNLPLREVKNELEAIDDVIHDLILEENQSLSFLESVNEGMVNNLLYLSSYLGESHKIALDRNSCYLNFVNGITVEYLNKKIANLGQASTSQIVEVRETMDRISKLYSSVIKLKPDLVASNKLNRNRRDIIKMKPQINILLGQTGKRRSRGLFGTIKKMFFE